MYSLSHIDGAMPPRLVRSVCLQALALLGIAFLAGRPWALAEPRPAPAPTPPPPQKQERRIRVVRLPPLPQARQVADAPHVPEHAALPPQRRARRSARPRARRLPRRAGPPGPAQPRAGGNCPVDFARAFRARLAGGDGPPRRGERIRADLLCRSRRTLEMPVKE